MSQYFENDLKLKDEPNVIHFELMNKNYVLQSNTGVFSKDKLDMGTRILLETVLKEEKKPNRVLDLGCWIGPVGVVLYQNWKSDIVMIDVNEKAISCLTVSFLTLRFVQEKRLCILYLINVLNI